MAASLAHLALAATALLAGCAHAAPTTTTEAAVETAAVETPLEGNAATSANTTEPMLDYKNATFVTIQNKVGYCLLSTSEYIEWGHCDEPVCLLWEDDACVCGRAYKEGGKGGERGMNTLLP